MDTYDDEAGPRLSVHRQCRVCSVKTKQNRTTKGKSNREMYREREREKKSMSVS